MVSLIGIVNIIGLNNIYSQNGCCPNGYISIGSANSNTNLSSLIGNPLLSVNNSKTQAQNICINGTLIIDGSTSYYFADYSNIIMQPNSKILIKDNGQLYCSSTNFSGCTSRWHSISLENNSNTNNPTLNLYRCNVQDAEYAVSVRGKAIVSLNNNYFSKNFISLYIPATSGGAKNEPIFSAFYANSFDGSNTLLSGSNSYFNNKPKCAIEIHNSKLLNIGLKGKSPNTFSNLTNGIMLFNTDANIENCTFSNIAIVSLLSPSKNGIAIYSKNALGQSSIVNVTGLGKYNSNTFSNCALGITFENTSCKLINCKYQNTVHAYSVGISVLNTNGAAIELINNNIIGAQFGMVLKNLLNTKTAIIGSNDLQMTNINNGQSVGLLLNNPLFPDASFNLNKFYISDNDIQHRGRCTGMWISGSLNLDISNNVVGPLINSNLLAGSYTSYLIENNNIDFQCIDNESYAIALTCANQCGTGFLFNNVTSQKGTFIGCNYSQGHGTGMAFNTSNRFITFRKNKMVDTYKGLLLMGDQTIIGEQFNQLNEWPSFSYTTNPPEAVNESSDPAMVSNSQFTVDPTFDDCGNGAGSEYWPCERVPTGKVWFTDGTGVTPDECGNTGGGLKPSTTKFDTMIVNRQFPDLPNDSEFRRRADHYLYNHFKDSTYLRSNWSELDHLLDSLAETNIANISNLQRLISYGSGLSDARKVIIESYHDSLSAYFSMIYAIDSLLSNRSGTDSIQLLSDRSNKLPHFDYFDHVRDSIIFLHFDELSKYKDTLIQYYNTIEPENDIESTHLDALDLMIRILPGGMVTDSTQEVVLKNLGSLCRFEFGDGVALARTLTNHIDTLPIEDYYCRPDTSNRIVQQNNNSLQKLEVAPNPFTDDAFVNASTFLDKGSYLNIYDSQGKFVKHYLVTEKTKKIAIKNLSQGLYHCILYDKNGKRIGFAHFIVFK